MFRFMYVNPVQNQRISFNYDEKYFYIFPYETLSLAKQKRVRQTKMRM